MLSGQKPYIPETALGYNPASDHAALATPMSHDPAAIRVLAVDEHPLRGEGVGGLIVDESDMTLAADAANGREAIEQFRTYRPELPTTIRGVHAGREAISRVIALAAVTEEAVSGQVKSILSKLDARDGTHAAVIGIRSEIIEP